MLIKLFLLFNFYLNDFNVYLNDFSFYFSTCKLSRSVMSDSLQDFGL